jgi:hypothetical protein
MAPDRARACDTTVPVVRNDQRGSPWWFTDALRGFAIAVTGYAAVWPVTVLRVGPF